ncbi:M48 family metallopeptidase [Pseudogemmobacter blasticus]|uniref:Peptidase M48 n=1 Tax=Fuscovulum blasticum DSM 2131 TaxID=1188250 RepID=A0A2T4JA39_FUSBL|nr:M48 family metallopeptidase [Fuscovulum blasticum]PTE14762.1 peptidase M48 [Fuscovulum blasticum DSM 2131]
MLRLTPLLLAIAYAVLMMRFSVWRTKKTLEAKSKPLTDPALTRLTDRMAKALDMPQIKVFLLDVDPVNGLAGPDGRIYLTRGFVAKKMQGEVTAEELASVVAHEMGHVALGHMRRRMIDFTGQNAAFMMLAAVLNRFLPFIGVWIANAISTALMARLSRRDEFEADAYATALLIKAGIGAGPQKSLFRKLDALTQNHAQGVPAWLLSHPRTYDRIAAIEANEARWLG